MLIDRPGYLFDPLRFWEARESKEFSEDMTIDAGGSIVCAGYVDIQFNGAFGVDFSDPNLTRTEVDYVAKRLLQSGVTSFLPTVVTSPNAVYHKVLPLFSPSIATVVGGAGILGAHCEGPFINKKKKGAHAEEHIVNCTGGMSILKEVYGDISNIRLVTLAPEIEGAREMIALLRNLNITVSIGHTTATLDVAEDAVNQGATLVTHLFNAMESFHHRDPGVVGLLGSPRNIFFSIIADGIHCHPYALTLAHNACAEGLVLITDCMAGGGLNMGTHKLGDREVEITKDRAVLKNTSPPVLAGSIILMDECVRTLRTVSGCSAVDAITAATRRPAQVLGMEDEIGSLEFGATANFLFLDDDLRVQATFTGGYLAWKRKP